MKQKINLSSPKHWLKIKTIDMHTGGEPVRIVVGGLPEIKGKNILEKRKYFSENFDHLRTGLMFEPRGHADMYGAVLTEPITPDGDFGVFFMHNQGYSTMCGHATLAITKLAIESGLVNYREGDTINIDAPPGRITATAKMQNGLVVDCAFKNVPSYVLLQNEVINVPRLGIVKFDIAYGGAYYALVDAKPMKLKPDGRHYNKLVDYGKRIKKAIVDKIPVNHPYDPELGFLYGVIFTGEAYEINHHSRNVCVFADGEVDRSATGTGMSARAALLSAKGELSSGKRISIESILGTTLDVEIIEEQQFANFNAVIPQVSGKAWFTGQHEFWFDPEDPLKKGFIFR